MTKKSKLISGQRDQKVAKKSRTYFSDEEKHLIIQEFLKGGYSKQEIWEKYTGQKEEHGRILRWMRKFGYTDRISKQRSTFVPKQISMKVEKQDDQAFDSFEESLQLKKRIEELEKQLKDAEMKSIAYSTMVDIAEKEFNISIRKKSNTKPSKK